MAAIARERDLCLLTPALLLGEENELIWSVTIPGVGFKVSRDDTKTTVKDSKQREKSEDKDIRNGGRFHKRVFATYFVAVTTSSGYRWTIPKRFSQFNRLHAAIKSEAPDTASELKLKLPGKNYISSSISPHTVQKRRVGLERYMATLAQYLEAGGKEVEARKKLNAIVRDFLKGGDSTRVTKEPRCSRVSSLPMEEKVQAKSSALRASISSSTPKKASMISFTRLKQTRAEVAKLTRNQILHQKKSFKKCAKEILQSMPKLEEKRVKKNLLMKSEATSSTIAHDIALLNLAPDKVNKIAQNLLSKAQGLLQRTSEEVELNDCKEVKELKDADLQTLVYREAEDILLKDFAMHDCLVSCAQGLDNNSVRDCQFKSKVNKLKLIYKGKGIPPSMFDAPIRSEADANEDTSTWGWSRAISLLNAVENSTLPGSFAKVDKLMDCVKEIHRGLLTQGDGKGKDFDIGADDILPVFIYCTANCSLEKTIHKPRIYHKPAVQASTRDRNQILVDRVRVCFALYRHLRGHSQMTPNVQSLQRVKSIHVPQLAISVDNT